MTTNTNAAIWQSNDANDKLDDLRLELLGKCRHRTPFAEANKEFTQLADALEDADPQDVYETMWDTVLGCGTPSSEYDPQGAHETAYELQDLLVKRNLVEA